MNTRLTELDGIRGWAALSVVVYHVYWECFGQLFPAFTNIWTSGFMNGPFAVCLFFVVSGAALSAPFYARPDRRFVLRSAMKRYPRLMLPIAAANAIAFLLYQLDLMQGVEASVLLERETWEGLNSGAVPTLENVVGFAVSDVFAGPKRDANILPFLWTMPIEMIGSMLLFVFLACYEEIGRKIRVSWILGGLLLVIFPYLAAFVLGSIIARNKVHGSKIAFIENGVVKVLAINFAVVFLFTESYFQIPMKTTLEVTAAFFVCYYAVNTDVSVAFLSGRLSRFLGKISFPLYLLHYLVIGTVLSQLVILQGGDIDLADALVIGLITIVASLAASVVFLPAELASHNVSRWFARYVLGEEAGVASRKDAEMRPAPLAAAE